MVMCDLTGGTGPALFVADAGPAGGFAGQVIVISPTPPYTFIGVPILNGCLIECKQW